MCVCVYIYIYTYTPKVCVPLLAGTPSVCGGAGQKRVCTYIYIYICVYIDI